MKRKDGFTVIELVIVVAFLGIASVMLLSQRANLVATHRDDQRKASISAMYYNLEEVYFAKNGYYPTSIDAETLPAMDPELFTDPSSFKLGDPESNYRYEASQCTDEKCQKYSLRSSLEREADFIKTNRNNK